MSDNPFDDTRMRVTRAGTIRLRQPGTLLTQVLTALRAAGPAGMTAKELAAATGYAHVAAQLSLYRDLGHVASAGCRPHKRWVLSHRRAHVEATERWERAMQERARVRKLVDRVLAHEGWSLSDLLAPEPPQPVAVPDDLSAAIAAASRAEMRSTAPTAQPKPKTSAARQAKPAQPQQPRAPRAARAAVPAPVVIRPRGVDRREVVVPPGAKLTICPSGQDTRYTVPPDAYGLGLSAEWRRLREGAA